MHISEWDEQKCVKWQVQWDSFFKIIAPKSAVVRRIVEDKFGYEVGAMDNANQLPSEMNSRRVAQALHLAKPWKELRGDGFFEYIDPLPVFGFEYQSSENTGMLLRTYMYGEAFDENFPNLARNGLEFVVLYSGNDMGKEKAAKQHNKMIEKTVRHLFIDLNHLPTDELENSDIYSLILRLSRRDATDFRLFQRASNQIDNLSDANERSKLKTALVVAAMNKSETAELAMRMNMDEITRNNLEVIIPIFTDMRLQDERTKYINHLRESISDLMDIGNAPVEAYDILENAENDELERIRTEVKSAARDQNWAGFTTSSNFNR